MTPYQLQHEMPAQVGASGTAAHPHLPSARAATEGFSLPWRNRKSSELANMSFAATRKQTKLNKKKDTVMKMKNNLLTKINTMQQSKWMRPALMSLAILATLLLVTGCPSPHH